MIDTYGAEKSAEQQLAAEDIMVIDDYEYYQFLQQVLSEDPLNNKEA